MKPKLIRKVHFIGEVSGAEGFGSGVSCCFRVEGGRHWTCLAGLEEGQTHVMHIDYGETFAPWNHPIDLHYTTKSIQVCTLVERQQVGGGRGVLDRSRDDDWWCALWGRGKSPSLSYLAVSGLHKSSGKYRGNVGLPLLAIGGIRTEDLLVVREPHTRVGIYPFSPMYSPTTWTPRVLLQRHPGLASTNGAGVAVGYARAKRAPRVRLPPLTIHPRLFRGVGAVLEANGYHAGQLRVSRATV